MRNAASCSRALHHNVRGGFHENGGRDKKWKASKNDMVCVTSVYNVFIFR